jgi:putative PIN family toxin of toxin-antitoxin system
VATGPLLRVVLDVNVYVSSAISYRGAPHEILRAWRQGDFLLATSDAILDDIKRALRYPKVRDQFGIAEANVQELIGSLRRYALVTPGDLAIEPAARDADDDKVLACAIEAEADCIVTGDKDLLSLGAYRGIAILRPADFLARLAHPDG